MKPNEKDACTLGEMVRLYHVGFRMQPGEAVAVSGRTTQITCRLELSGHHDSRFKCGDAPCHACIQVLQSLFEVADILRPIGHETLDGTGSGCTTQARYASAAGPGHEETLGLDMTIRQPLELWRATGHGYSSSVYAKCLRNWAAGTVPLRSPWVAGLHFGQAVGKTFNPAQLMLMQRTESHA